MNVVYIKNPEFMVQNNKMIKSLPKHSKVLDKNP